MSNPPTCDTKLLATRVSCIELCRIKKPKNDNCFIETKSSRYQRRNGFFGRITGLSNKKRRLHSLISIRKSFFVPLIVGISLGLTLPYVLWGIRTIPKGIWYRNVDILENIPQDDDDPVYAGEDVASALKDKVRVLCWVMTHPGNHKKKAKHVKATWARRCNTILFMSSVEDKELPSVPLPVEGRHFLWGKTKEAFKYVFNHYDGAYDWVLKADDDTFVIMENLRYLLNRYDPNEPLYLGCRFKPYVKMGYMQGGAGYVLSKEAVRRFVVDGLGGEKCRADNGDQDCAEDVEMGKCMELLGAEVPDTRDRMGRNRFLPSTPLDHLIPNRNEDSFWNYFYYYPSNDGLNCCSDTAVSFHYVSPFDMYLFNYFLYHLRPYGINQSTGENDTNIKDSSLKYRRRSDADSPS